MKLRKENQRENTFKIIETNDDCNKVLSKIVS